MSSFQPQTVQVELPARNARPDRQAFWIFYRGPGGRGFSAEQEGLAPGGLTERKHLDLTIVDTPLGS